MAKLVVLSVGMTGRTQELKAEKTTIGRVEDNTFQITEPSVSSHHCEVLLRGKDVVVRDLNSTNGSYINGEKMLEYPEPHPIQPSRPKAKRRRHRTIKKVAKPQTDGSTAPPPTDDHS